MLSTPLDEFVSMYRCIDTVHCTGETLLHVLIICDTKLHTRLARTLIKCFPKLALDAVEGEEYLGTAGRRGGAGRGRVGAGLRGAGDLISL